MASVKFVAVSRGLSGILDYVTNPEKATDALITGVNCVAQAMELSYDREQFIRCMEAWGYGVKWEDGHKHITYTTPDNIRCRGSKLFDQTLLWENVEHYFAMGGREYLETRREWRELGEPEPTLDDAVCSLASIFEALEAGGNKM